MTMLTDKQEPFVRAIRIRGITAHGARLARVVGVHLDGHASMHEGFVGDHALQFGKGPFGVGSIGLSLLPGLIIPEFRGSDVGSMPDQGYMLIIACVGHNHPPIQGQDAHLGIFLQAIVPMEVIGQGGRDILRWLIQSLVAFPGLACFACLGILLHLRPERFVGRPDLAGDIAGHLSRQAKLQADIIVALSLQGPSTAHLAMRKGVLTHRIQGIAVCQLRATQCHELIGRGIQFQLGGDDLFHSGSIVGFHTLVKLDIVREIYCGIPPRPLNGAGLLPQFVESYYRL